MATTIVTKKGSGAPAASDLVEGELAVDTTNGRLYTENSSAAVVELGSNPSGNITFGDNGKAIFGAGSDLEIYHDGTNNRLTFVSANTYIQTNGVVHFTDIGNNEKHLTINDDGAVDLYHNNALKLATTATGIDVTGDVNTSGLLKVGTNDTEYANNYLRFKPTGAAYIDHNTVGQSINFRLSNASSLDKTVMTLSSAGNVGIGTSSVTNKLEVDGGSSPVFARISTTNAGGKVAGLILANSGKTAFNDGVKISHGGGFTTFDDLAGTTNLTINQTTGYVGIGVSPTAKLDINISTNARGYFSSSIGEVGAGNFALQVVDATGVSLKPLGFRAEDIRFATLGGERMRIDASGNVGIGTSSPASPTGFGSSGILHLKGGTGNDCSIVLEGLSGSGGRQEIGASGGALQFYRGAATGSMTESMRIDASGNLLVGTTSASTATQGVKLRNDLDAVAALADGQPSGYFGRLNSDGDILNFNKAGTTVGSIGTVSSNLLIGTGDTGFRFFDGATKGIFPDTTSGAGSDDAIDLGKANARFDDIYATNGTIQTSDRNEKQDIEALSDAEQRVAVAAKGLLRKFRWKSSVAEKGDEARTHFGIIAQDLQAAFEAEGLDAGNYAMFIHSTWTDEETGEERSRMGVRYSELLAFIIAAI